METRKTLDSDIESFFCNFLRNHYIDHTIIFYLFILFMIDKKNLYAVVWASNSIEKYWYKVFKDLLEWGYLVVPIHPTEKEILWQKVSPTLSDHIKEWKKTIDVVIFVVPPAVTEKVLEEVKKLEIKNVWMQPWAESDAAISFCEKNWINCVHDACIMIQRKILNP